MCDAAPHDVVPRRAPSPGDATALLVFTSGTSGAPKAAIVSQRRLARYGRTLSAGQELTAESVCYLAMPMFHSNALYAGWSPAVYVGATIALRRRFSASGFLDDVRRYRATYFNYVGKPLSYILATPPRPDDRDHTLVRVVGNEGTEHDIARFSERFGVPVIDNYGSTEGGVTVMRSPDQPKGALGRLPDGVLVVDPETRHAARARAVRRRRPARQPGGVHRRDREHRRRARSRATTRTTKRSASGRGTAGTGRATSATPTPTDGCGSRDATTTGCASTARTSPPRRSNASSAGSPGVVLGAVYAVPATDVGDDVMVALQLEPGVEFDPRAFDEFLAAPTRPRREVEPALRADRRRAAGHRDDQDPEAPSCAPSGGSATDPVWWRPERAAPLRRLTADDVAAIRQAFVARGRGNELDSALSRPGRVLPPRFRGACPPCGDTLGGVDCGLCRWGRWLVVGRGRHCSSGAARAGAG